MIELNDSEIATVCGGSDGVFERIGNWVGNAVGEMAAHPVAATIATLPGGLGTGVAIIILQH